MISHEAFGSDPLLYGMLTLCSNMLTNLNLTDMECCYKAFHREVIQSLEIIENRFGFEPEIMARIARKGLRICEVGISYYGRTYKEGNKINRQDGLGALDCGMNYNHFLLMAGHHRLSSSPVFIMADSEGIGILH